MVPGSANDGNKYEWQSWPADSLEGMPPKHRRLVVWGLLWVMFLSFVLRSILDAVGIREPWSSLVLAAVLAAIFIPSFGYQPVKPAPFEPKASTCLPLRLPARQ